MPQWLLELGGALKDEGTIALLIVVATTAGTLIRTFLAALRQAQNTEAAKPPLPNPAAAAQVAFAGDRMTVDALVTGMAELGHKLDRLLVRLDEDEEERKEGELMSRLERKLMERLKPPGE